MYTQKTYRAVDMIMWTRFETALFVSFGAAWVAVYTYFELHWFKIPWSPLALIGTAVAFVIGFQNNSAYGRIWEARKIWGGIVNSSRTFGVYVQDMLSSEDAKQPVADGEVDREIKTLIYRHIAWMTALRHSMRGPKPWETAANHRTNQEWNIHPPERSSDLATDLQPYLSSDELRYVLDKSNPQTATLYLQSSHLAKLREQGLLWEFSFLQLETLIQELFALQGKSERIKNFPYPRQFASLNHYFMWLFAMLLPMALIPQFAEIGHALAEHNQQLGALFVWVSVPFYAAVAWVFHTMERIGRTGENPFEGTSNDVPISTIARGIEIDLRQNLGEPKDSIPEQFQVQYDIQF